jgi:hypothetical protein
VEEWKDGDVQIQHLSGGLTNTNYKVTVDGKPYFIRVPGEGTELLAIDRNNEFHNSRAAANAGVAPEIIRHFPEHNVMVLKFLEVIKAKIQIPLDLKKLVSQFIKVIQRVNWVKWMSSFTQAPSNRITLNWLRLVADKFRSSHALRP